MTREEAIRLLADYIDYDNPDTPDFYEMEKACKVAIQALQEPTGDLISRQAVIDIFDKWLSYGDYNYSERNIMNCAIAEIEDLPSAENTGHWIYQSDKKKPMYAWFYCDSCGSYIGTPTRYCSECGSRMVEKGEQTNG